jgi:hypothetical protein
MRRGGTSIHGQVPAEAEGRLSPAPVLGVKYERAIPKDRFIVVDHGMDGALDPAFRGMQSGEVLGDVAEVLEHLTPEFGGGIWDHAEPTSC